MTQTTTEGPERPDLPEPVIKRRRISFIWTLPLVAAIAAGWLGYTTLKEKGPTIKITFQTATGIEAGKTLIKHNDIQLGMVQRVDPTPDLEHVIVTAQMNVTATDHLHAGTQFWVVRPRLSLTSFSGLETLISGVYIEMDPGSGADERTFKALEEPPVVRSGVTGTEYVLTTNKLGSIGAGSPIFFRSINVGEATGYTFEGVDKGIVIHIFVRAPYDALINDRTQFWNDSGISFTSGANGFKLQVDSLEAVLAGGIAFETQETDRQRPRSESGASFVLYDDRDSAQESVFTRRSRAIVEFEGSAHGLEAGAPVELRGIKVGQVIDLRLVVDAADHTVRVPVTVAIDFDRLGVINFPSRSFGSGELARNLVAAGFRAQLRTSSLLTGQQYVAFDFFPDAAPAEVDMTGPIPRLPTVPSQLEGIMQSASKFLDKLDALPLDIMIKDVNKVLVSVDRVVGGPELAESLRSLNRALASAQQVMQDAQPQIAPLLQSVRRLSEAADATVKRADATLATMGAAYGRDSEVRADLVQLLRELEGTSRSFTGLANFLEQHPESLIQGKAHTK